MCLGVKRHLASGHEISSLGLQHGLQLFMARYTRIINCRPCCNLYVDVGRIRSSYDQLHGAGSHTRMTESEFRVLRLNPNLDPANLNKLLDVARIYDVSAHRRRIVYELEIVKQRERMLGSVYFR